MQCGWDDIKSVKLIQWPQRVEELEEEEELSPLIVKLLSALRSKKGGDLPPSTLSLTSLITQYATKQPTTTAINDTITRHGRSLSIPTTGWAWGSATQMCFSCVMSGSCMTSNGVQCVLMRSFEEKTTTSISIIDNDDFPNDTLTGEGTSHRCN